MVTILAAGAAVLGLFNGAGWSRERTESDLKQPVSRNGWPVESIAAQSPASDTHRCHSIPDAIQMDRVPSLIDAMREKWCAPK